MNIVVVGSALPYPANSGNRIRTLSLLVRLADRHTITLLGTRNADRVEGRAAIEFLGDHHIEAVEVNHRVPSKSGLGFHARLAANLVSPLPYSVASHHGRNLTRAVYKIAASRHVDVWQAEWAAGVMALRGLPAARRVLMAHNVETLIWERYAETETNPLKRWYIHQQAHKFAAFERKAFTESDRVVAVSPDDAALIRNRFGCDRVDVVDNGIDRPFFESVVPDRDPGRILFLGSLEWRPNLDALNLLLDTIFPAVRQAEPSACLDVVGRNPPSALIKRLAETPGATLHANVADVRPYLARSGVMAVPLRVGGGSRLKILEALATGLPVVSSRVGAEGLELRPGVDLDIVENAEEMAPALINALRDPVIATMKAEQARSHVLERYDWDRLADLLERSWERARGVVNVYAEPALRESPS